MAVLAGLQSKQLIPCSPGNEFVLKLENELYSRIKLVDKKESPSIPFM
jgi:hypothetical protein